MNLDTTVLTTLGINLQGDDAANFTAHFEQTLEEHVGLAIFDLLTDTEAEELIALQNTGDDAAINEWIAANVPEYADIVQDEFDILMAEIANNSEALAV